MRHQLIEIPRSKDPSGDLSIIEKEILPFDMKRIYYLFDIPSGSKRGGHAHINQDEFLIPVSGSFDVVLNNGDETHHIHLNKPAVGLLIPHGYWRELENFSSGAVCLVLASDIFLEEDYIRDFHEFLEFKRSKV